MEEYRRKYLSPTYLRSSTYAETVQKDKTVSELRKQLQECKEMEEKFDDLCLQIVKLERENKKIQSEQASIEGQYIEKIKKNKTKITELKQDVLDSREKIETKTKKVTLLEVENKKLTQEIERIEKERQQLAQEQSSLQGELIHHQEFVKDLKGKIVQTGEASKEKKNLCQKKSEQLDLRYKCVKENEVKLKEEQKNAQQMKLQLENVKCERQLWQKKLLISQAEVKSLKNQLELEQKVQIQKSKVCSDMEKENQYYSSKYGNLRTEMKRFMMQNSDKAKKLKQVQQVLFQKVKNMEKSQQYLESMSRKQVQLHKSNERLEEIVKNYSQTLSEEQEGYKRVISHMKESILQDEKAIEGLVKQANLLQNMIV